MENPNVITTKCPWNLSSYFGRWMYYSWITNPKLNFTKITTIEEAKKLHIFSVYELNTTDISEARILYAKQVYENAFHPHTEEKQNVLGRLSFIPIGKSLLFSILFVNLSKNYSNISSYICHGTNQFYDSFVNFTNRNGDTKAINHPRPFGISVLVATALSTFAAYRTERFLSSKICHHLLYRFIPLSTLIIANITNVPVTRFCEIINGVGIYDCNKDRVGYSKVAAIKGVGETVITRIVMFAPGLYLMQYLNDVLDNRSCWYRKNKWVHFFFQSIGMGLILIGMLPTACAIFPQFSSIESQTLQKLDNGAYNQIVENCFDKIPHKVYFNKGL